MGSCSGLFPTLLPRICNVSRVSRVWRREARAQRREMGNCCSVLDDDAPARPSANDDLVAAAAEGDVKAVRAALDAGADVNAKDAEVRASRSCCPLPRPPAVFAPRACVAAQSASCCAAGGLRAA